MAVTIDSGQLEAILKGTESASDNASRLLAVATALVTEYAPDAPDSIQTEAAIRVAGYLRQHPAAAINSESAGPLNVSYAPAMISALRHSGAMALLTRWKKRRGGVVKEPAATADDDDTTPETPVTPPVETYRLGISADTVFTEAELTITGHAAGLTVQGIPAGERRYVGYARRAALGNFTYVHIYAQGAQPPHRNQIVGWMQEAAPLDIGGVDHTVIRSRAALASNSNGLIFEAG